MRVAQQSNDGSYMFVYYAHIPLHAFDLVHIFLADHAVAKGGKNLCIKQILPMGGLNGKGCGG